LRSQPLQRNCLRSRKALVMQTESTMQLRPWVNKRLIFSIATSKLTILFLSLPPPVLTQGKGAVSLRSHLRRRTACTATRRRSRTGIPHHLSSPSQARINVTHVSDLPHQALRDTSGQFWSPANRDPSARSCARGMSHRSYRRGAISIDCEENEYGAW
jgi:hypothetical protein